MQFFTRFVSICVLVVLSGFALAQSPIVAPPPIVSATSTTTAAPLFISSGGGNVNVNNYLGANALYAAGYTGTRSIMVNIEGQHIWSGHESLTQVTQLITGPGALGTVGSHPTSVGFIMGGRPTGTGNSEQKRGMAYGATLWSGAIATSVNGNNFDITFNSFFQPYVTSLRTGIGGLTADVSNSSWGDDVNTSSGRTIETRAIDALAYDTGKVIVFAAGNSGSSANTVLAPATGYNVISVAALTNDTTNPAYNAPAGFSSRGPQDVFIPSGTANGTTGSTVSGGRIRVDIAAPGDNLTLADTSSSTNYSGGHAGTSFAAPTVAGGVALMVDAGRAQAPVITNYADIRVVKAVLMTSADKTSGWNNGQAINGGVIRTTQALDTAVGAGRMNLAQAMPFYTDTNSTRDVAGTVISSPVTVQNRGYDFAAITRTGHNDYVLPENVSAVSRFSVTLTWLANRGISSFAALPNNTDVPGADYFFDNKLANLNLQVYRLGAGGSFDTLVAESVSDYNNTEHLFLTDLIAGRYGIRINYTNDVWNFTSDTSETYGLAWNFVPVPEPSGIFAIGAIVLVGLARLRRRR